MTSAHVTLSAALPVDELAQAAEGASARDQFAELLAAHWDRAYRFAYHLTGNNADSDDLIQQAAEEAFRAFHRFQPGTRFDRWFFRIMHNSFVDRIRRDRRRKIFSLDEVTGAVASETADPSAIAEGALDGPVLRALRALPPDARAVVALVDLLGLPYDDAAEILHCPVGTIRSRLHRARLALREWLRPYVDAMKRGDL
ncbi:MAG TPA: sigma-70 family RNA polymerase sigma factor [bacterium]|nr:sigma-70 family RNA polymerase sigma factor [bacterium]